MSTNPGHVSTPIDTADIAVARNISRSNGAANPNEWWLVLDAKGVLYRHGYDVNELLIPYAHAHGSTATAEDIRSLYLEASIGAKSSRELWRDIGLGATGSDQEYCALHRPTPGLTKFLAAIRGPRLACLSNDVSEWSLLLRRRFALERTIDHWLVSGDVGLRKPDPRIYELLERRLGTTPDRVIFVDDRLVNLEAAARRGWTTIQFGGQPRAAYSVSGFSELASLIRSGDLLAGRVESG